MSNLDWREFEDVETVARFPGGVPGREYRLGIHDPMLSCRGKNSLPPALEAVLIAPVVEMNPLDRSHVYGVQTRDSEKPRRVPCEYGRAKSRRLYSMQGEGPASFRVSLP